MVLSQLLAPLLSSVPPNDWYRAMIVQFLLAMVQDRLSNEEAGELLNQQVHVVTMIQRSSKKRETLSESRGTT